jgi:hypothetical protein
LINVAPQEIPQKRKGNNKESKRELMQYGLRNTLPSNLVDLKKYYLDELYVPAKEYWKLLYPNLSCPLPHPSDEWSLSMCGFLLYCITFSFIQLVSTKSGFAPKILVDNGLFDIAVYFPKFVVFVIVNRVNQVSPGWDTKFLGSLPSKSKVFQGYPSKKVMHNITSNTRLPTLVYTKINIKSNFEDFWNAAKQYEGSDDYYLTNFKVEKADLFPIPF